MDKAARKCIFIGYTDTTTQYRLYDPIGKPLVISHDVIFEESTSYYNTSDTVGQESRRYYAPEIQPWEEDLAWGDEFDKEEPLGEKAPERRVREEEQEQVFDWGDAEEVLAPFHLPNPRVESSWAGQSCNGGEGGGDDDNDADREEMAFVMTRKKRRKSDTPGMVRGLRADMNSSYWESQKGKLPTTEGMGSTHSKSGSGTSNTGTSEAIVSAVNMVEAGPNTYQSAMESTEACEWQEAIDSECASLEMNKVLTFVHEIPETKKAITTKLILQRKLNPVGQTVRYKAPLVAQGFRQVQGLDFTDTFAPVASLSIVRVVLSIAAAKSFAVRQMDVVTAFLGREPHEEVYVSLPVGVFGRERLACLNHSLYGLKQSPRCWYTTIDNLLITKMGFCHGRFDCGIYTHDNRTILALYVDDMLIAGALGEVKLICDKFRRKFQMADLGTVSHFLGMVVSMDTNSHMISLTQEG